MNHLSQGRREVIIKYGSNYEAQVLQALASNASNLKLPQIKAYFNDIRDFLEYHAHTCVPLYQIDGHTVYMYKPEPLSGFNFVKVFFTAGTDDEGDYIVMEKFKWG